jgi:putative ABC transport system permease protein
MMRLPGPGELWRRLVYLLRRDRMSAELEEEMRLHVELRADAMRRSGAPDNAQYVATRRFGNQVTIQQESRDMWGMHAPEQFAQDLKFSVRRLRQRPGFAAAVIAVLALGIGATTAMFSAVDAAMLRPLPFTRPGELVTLRSVSVPFDPGPTNFPRDTRHMAVDLPDAVAMTGTFSSVAAYAAGGLNISDPERPIRANAGVVTVGFFNTLGVAPLVGRGFVAEEGVPNGPRAVVLSYALWRRQFGGQPLEKLTAQLNGRTYQVIGVMPPGFGFPKASELWIPMTVPTTFETFEPFRGFLASETIARLAPGVTAQGAGARLLASWESLAPPPEPGRERNSDRMVNDVRSNGALAPLQQTLVGDKRTALLVLFGATGFLLLIACANVTNLLLSQATARRREIALRSVLGATRGRVVRQLLTESAVLSLLGAALGVATAPVTLKVLRLLMPDGLSGVAPAEVDWRVLGFAATLGVITGIAFGLWPALGTTRSSAGETIKSGGGHGATSFGAGRTRRLLVGAELALALMLLVGAGLMLRSFGRLMSLDMGMRTERVATLELSFPRSVKSPLRMERANAIIERLAGVPGIQAVGIVNDLPLRGGGGISLRITDPVPPGVKGFAGARMLMASPGYFDALGIRLIAGRTFLASDDSLGPPVSLVSETMAKTFWPGVSPLGRTYSLSTGPDAKPVTVIGVVSDVREMGLDKDPMPQMYNSIAAVVPSNVAVVARGTLPPAALLARLAEAVRAVDPSQAVYNLRMMDDVVGASVAPRRANTLLIGLFAALALVLAALGVYAVVAYGVAQRSREFGIRAALGATGPNLVALVAGEMGWVVAAGLATGLVGAWMLSKVLSTLLYGITAHDAVTFVVVPFALVIPAVLATIVPARRAAKVNPAEVMRAE